MRNLFTLGILAGFHLCVHGQMIPETSSADSSIHSLDSAGSIQLADTMKPSPRTRQVYKLKPAVDIPVATVGTAWSLYAFTKIYSKDRSDEDDILALNIADIPKFDRHGATV
jgi:hypothetical protein